MGSAGNSPAPVGDPPSGTVERTIAKRVSPSIWIVVLVPSGESPDGTGESPVLPGNESYFVRSNVYWAVNITWTPLVSWMRMNAAWPSAKVMFHR